MNCVHLLPHHRRDEELVRHFYLKHPWVQIPVNTPGVGNYSFVVLPGSCRIYVHACFSVVCAHGKLHFEDSWAPQGEKDYRPDGTPTKVGLWMEMVRERCMQYLPGNNVSFDEGTAKYSGRMSKLKHKQSRYKPYDGIRVYMLNDSATG